MLSAQIMLLSMSVFDFAQLLEITNNLTAIYKLCILFTGPVSVDAGLRMPGDEHFLGRVFN